MDQPSKYQIAHIDGAYRYRVMEALPRGATLEQACRRLLACNLRTIHRVMLRDGRSGGRMTVDVGAVLGLPLLWWGDRAIQQRAAEAA